MDALEGHLDEAKLGELPGIIGKLEEFKARAWARMTSPQPPLPPAPPTPSVEPAARLVDIHEAAKILRMSRSWLYRNSNSFPFVVRVNKRNIRFSVQGMKRWMREHSRG